MLAWLKVRIGETTHAMIAMAPRISLEEFIYLPKCCLGSTLSKSTCFVYLQTKIGQLFEWGISSSRFLRYDLCLCPYRRRRRPERIITGHILLQERPAYFCFQGRWEEVSRTKLTSKRKTKLDGESGGLAK